MRNRLVLGAGALVVAVVIFLAGLSLGATGIAGLHPTEMTADGYVGQQVATFTVGNTAYGVRSSVPWRDAAGTEHDGGWPACLTPGHVQGVRFAGGIVTVAGSGQAEVLWVDCEGR